jgi:RNA exonuclease NGL2
MLIPAIEHRYSYIYTSGRGKAHGCIILFKKELFELHGQKTVYYDEEEIRHGSLEGGEEEKSDIWRRGGSRTTRNIGLVAAIRRKGSSEKGFVVATTHLFWHPAFVYERTKSVPFICLVHLSNQSRQVGLLLRSISTFRHQNTLEHWPCFIAGGEW